MTTLPEHPAGVSAERADGVVTIRLARPERMNALDEPALAALGEHFAEASRRDDDRAVVITGTGRGFCTGADVAALTGGGRPWVHFMRATGQVALALHHLPKPTIAKVNGAAVGLGCNLAFGCDLVVASEAATFSQIFPRRGLSVDFGGSWLLPRRVGLHRAKELAFFGDILSAAEAAELGLVNRVVPADELDAFVDDWAKRLAAGPTLALAASKSLLNAGAQIAMSEALENEALAQALNLASADAREAMRAFVEKREPIFEGR